MKYITIADAYQYLPEGWDKQPSIDKTGHVRKMVKHYEWKPGHAFRIGNRIYHFKGGTCFYTAKRIARQ